jgi:hypothetical protein
MMSEESERVTRAYKRAGLGLAAAALLWTVVLLFGIREESKTDWVIPICAAALSMLCFSLYRKQYRDR